MKGSRSGVQKLIKNENLSLYDIGCICHLADLCIKAGMSTLPLDIDQIFIDIYYYFHHSSKRNQEFIETWCSFYTNEPKVILKHCQTSWLSLLRCVDRYLEQLPGLISYFLSCDQTTKVVSIAERLQNPLIKPLLLFLKHVLPFMDRFNRSFGTDCVAELEKEMDMKPFFSAIKQFYLATLKKMFKKFPFEDTLLRDMGIKTASYTVNTVHRLAKWFPQIELASSCSLDCLAEEFTDFVLSPSDLPPLMYYKDCDGTDKPRPGPFWWEVEK